MLEVEHCSAIRVGADEHAVLIICPFCKDESLYSRSHEIVWHPCQKRGKVAYLHLSPTEWAAIAGAGEYNKSEQSQFPK